MDFREIDKKSWYVDGSGSGSRLTTNLDVSSDGHSGLIPNKYDYVQLLIPVLIRYDVQNFGELIINMTGSVLDNLCSVLDFSGPGILLIRSIYTTYLIRSSLSIERYFDSHWT
jgi:hypothetical protein